MISPEQCQLIADALKLIAWRVAHDPNSQEVYEYLVSKPLYIFAQTEEYDDFFAFDITPDIFLKKYRSRFLAYLSFIIDWFSDRDDQYVNIEGM